MQRFFTHAIVSMLLVSLMLSACYTTRNLSMLADRDAVTIEQARYDELSATPHEQLSAVELAERDSLQRTQFERVSVRGASEEKFGRQLLIRRDSIILDQARYEELLSTPPSELGQSEATELETLEGQQSQRDNTLAAMEADLQGRRLSASKTIGVVFLGIVLTAVVVFAALYVSMCTGVGEFCSAP